VNDLLTIGLSAFGISLVLTPILRDIFRAFRVVDQPDSNRKFHIYPIPRVGGIAIAAGYFIILHLMLQNTALDRELSILWRLQPAAIVVFATGLIDDMFGLKPLQKLFGQLAGGALACWGGVEITGIGGVTIPSIWSVPLTIGWLIVCTNAFNLVDGLDGLAAGVGLFATMTMFVAALLQGNEPLAFATLPLAGCLLGFLCFNFSPATVFLGDCGSLLLGFLLGSFGVIWAQKSVTLFGLTAPLMALSVPLIDVLLCIARRWLSNKPIFSADRGHIHHRLLDRGLNPRQAVFILYGLSSLAAMFSLAQTFMQNVYFAGLIATAFVVAVWAGVHYLGYAEFMLASRMLRVVELQRNISANLTLSSFEKSLSRARTPDEWWEVLTRAAETFGFAGIRMQVNSSVYSRWADGIREPEYWFATIPLSHDGSRIEFARQLGSPILPMVVVPFIDLVALTLSAKLKEQVLSDCELEAPAAVRSGG
jgi:UDP-GlcNAc:undecaprenyl-phosphate/decaprenyl-phosphate GlcNAc-1-phosphate transferase